MQDDGNIKSIKDLDLVTYLYTCGIAYEDAIKDNGTTYFIFPVSSELDTLIQSFQSGNDPVQSAGLLLRNLHKLKSIANEGKRKG